MHPDRAAVHEAADAGRGRGLDQVPGGVHVNLPVERVRHPGAAEHRGQMEHHCPAFHRALDDQGIPYVPLDHFGAGAFQLRHLARLPRQGPYRVPSRSQRAGEREAGEPAGAGDQNRGLRSCHAVTR